MTTDEKKNQPENPGKKDQPSHSQQEKLDKSGDEKTQKTQNK